MTEPTSPPRRFPPPWQAVEHAKCFEVQDATGQSLAFVYFEDEADRRDVMKRLTRDEARRIASNIARLPGLLLGPDTGGSASVNNIDA